MEPGAPREGSQRCPRRWASPWGEAGGPEAPPEARAHPSLTARFPKALSIRVQILLASWGTHVPGEGGLWQVSLLPVSGLPYPLWALQVFSRRMWYPSQWMGLSG